MATPSDVRLRLVLDSNNPRDSIAIVTYLATFTAAEVAGNLRSRERICLFGEDPPPGPIGNDLLFCFPPRVIQPDGQASRVIRRRASVPNIVLDEDPGPLEDEVYARVCLRPLDGPGVVRCARSGVISSLAVEEGPEES